MDENALKIYYAKYLKEIRGVSDSTVKHYDEALKYISKYLVEKGKLQQSIYEIQDIGELENLRAYLYSDSGFMALDKRGHHMYTCGFKNYYKFACGETFSNMRKPIEIMDTEIPVSGKRNISQMAMKRSSIIKIQVIQAAGYKCEINPLHETFVAKSSGHPYMEGHHVLLLKFQDAFHKSLDVYANIICLCPVCHRFLHYGLDSEREYIADKIFYDRVDRLAASGIVINKNDFKKFACDYE